MNEHALENMVETFQSLRDAVARQPPMATGPILAATKMFSKHGRDFTLQGDALAEYRRLLSKFQKRPWNDRWSEGYIEDVVQGAISKAWYEPEQAAMAFSEAAAELDAEPPTFLVTIPLSGVELQMDELYIGRTRLRRMDAEKASIIMGAVNRISLTMKGPQNAKDTYVTFTQRTVDQLIGATIAEISEPGDPDLAQGRAETRCLTAIDVLQFMAGLFAHSEQRIRVDFRSVESAGFRSVLLLSEDGTHFVQNQNRFGPSGSFLVTPDIMEQMKSSRLIEIFDILSKEDTEQTEIEELIVRATHWFADAELQRNPSNKLQSYVTCLDMFFSSRDGEATTAVQDGIAYLLGGTAEQRIEIHKFVGAAYDYRSRASHEGADFRLPEMIVKLKSLTVNFLATIVERRADLQTKKALKQWVYEQRMT
jgi:hypothetical protein